LDSRTSIFIRKRVFKKTRKNYRKSTKKASHILKKTGKVNRFKKIIKTEIEGE